MGRFIVIVLDGFGIGAMLDAKIARPGDEISNTFGSILSKYPKLKLANLERLGLMNAYGKESKYMKFSPDAVYGKSELMHFGADTFMGHQEIMGTLPKKPLVQPFSEKIDEIAAYLRSYGHKIKLKEIEGLQYLLVDDFCTVGDNIDADLGVAYNCTAPLDFIPFAKELEIARRVREIAKVNRVIPFGGTGTTIEDILNAAETREHKFVGIHAVKSKSYEQGYECLHLGYGVDETVQVPTMLAKENIDVTLLGKVADIVKNDAGISISCVDTTEVLDITIEKVKSMEHGFICTNVQETDLAGHSQNTNWYKELLEIADAKIGLLLNELNEDDILIVMADHGNDPEIGHNRHTRENVPLLIHSKKTKVEIGLSSTLSDVGATACDYFHAKEPQNGISFLKKIYQ